MHGSLSDNEIMIHVKNGDLDKMTILFDRHHRALFGFLYHMTHNRETSEDIVQTVFYRMLKYRSTFKGNGEFKAWMYYLSINVLKDTQKKNKHSSDAFDINDVSSILGDKIMIDDSLNREQEIEILIKSMDHLSSGEREILVLTHFQKLKYQEIAQILNITEGAVKVRVHRALNQLKSIYLKKVSYGVR
jgi:RNA polymerase sigma-70 factor (ECF subfamily)